jgi:hypothetical protein
MYCFCVNVYCHRVSTQLQLTNIPIYQYQLLNGYIYNSEDKAIPFWVCILHKCYNLHILSFLTAMSCFFYFDTIIYSAHFTLQTVMAVVKIAFLPSVMCGLMMATCSGRNM